MCYDCICVSRHSLSNTVDGEEEMGNQKRQLFVPGPPKFTKRVSFSSAFRVIRFRLPVSGPLTNAQFVQGEFEIDWSARYSERDLMTPMSWDPLLSV